MSLPRPIVNFLTRQRWLLVALVVALFFHGALLLAGSYRGTYDAYVHIFFGDHYRRDWFSLWDTRWYTGFTLVSYPPLTHQLIGLIAKLTGNLTTGFVIVMLTSSLTTTLGVYRFSRLWINERAAGYAALLTAFSSSIAETVHVFGQLPTMFVMGVMLNALPFIWSWLKDARLRDLIRGWAMLMIAAAGHHVTTLFGMVFFSGPIIATILLLMFRTPRADEGDRADERVSLRTLLRWSVRRVRRVFPTLVRTGVFGVGLILILVITVLPYWLWSKSDPITQISIPHASRDSFLQNTAAGLMFFLVPWGVQLIAFPYALYKGFGSRNWILAASFAGCAFLGTGGTTPLPAFLLKGAYYILTLDRFTFWSTILILPFAGQFVESLVHGRLGAWIAGHFGAWWRIGFISVYFGALIAVALFTANLTQFRKFQPAPLDMTPIVEFLAKDNHDHWRYLTLGLGDQMAWLSAQTTALNVEGNYHSARRLPEMTSTPVERLDGAKFTGIPGLGSLQQFLTNPQRYNLKYVFSNDAFYDPLLYFSGWHRLGRLDNDVIVWERSDVPPLPSSIPVQVYPTWQRMMWGILPVGSIVITLIVFIVTTLIVPRIRWRSGLLDRVRRIRLINNWLFDAPGQAPEPGGDWQFWTKIVHRFFPRINIKPLPRRIIYGIGLLALIAIIGVVGILAFRRTAYAPERVLLDYYDAIDFKRFSDSYAYLDTDLTREEYLRWLSLRGGLVASFAKLDNLYTTITPIDATHLQADVTAEWVTALGTYPQAVTYQLNLTAEGWRIQFDETAPPRPRETFVAAPTTDWFQNLPLGTLDETALTRGVIDRSLVSASPATVIYRPEELVGFLPTGIDANRQGRFYGMISVIGWVTNRDPYPADVTITAILRGEHNERLAETNTMDVQLHQLLPGETTPYRVDFFGAEGSGLMDIETVASVELNIRGVPTPYNLARQLTLIGPNELYNTGATMVDVPRVLIAHMDHAQNLTWVDGYTLELSIAPDDRLSFELPAVPDDLQTLNVPVIVNGPRLADWALPDNITGSLYLLPYGFTR